MSRVWNIAKQYHMFILTEFDLCLVVDVEKKSKEIT